MSALYTVREYEVNDNLLVQILCEIMKEYKKKKKCAYTMWLSKDLGIPKLVLEMFVIKHSNVFITKLGRKSNNLIIEEVLPGYLVLDKTFMVHDATGLKNIFIKPVAFVSGSNYTKVVCNKWTAEDNLSWYEEESVELLLQNR